MTATIDAPNLPAPRRPSYPPVVIRRLPPLEPETEPFAGPVPADEPAAPPPAPPKPPGNPRVEIEAVLRLIMEMLDGRRATTQAGGRIAPMALRYLVAARTRLKPVTDRRVGPPRHGPPGLKSVRMSHPAGEVTEASAVWVYRGRPRALAARFEWRADRWRCTVLRLG